MERGSEEVVLKAKDFIKQIQDMGYDPVRACFSRTDLTPADKLRYKKKLYELEKAVNNLNNDEED